MLLEHNFNHRYESAPATEALCRGRSCVRAERRGANKNMKKIWPALILSAALPVACGAPDNGDNDDEIPEIGTSARAICPTSSDCNAVSTGDTVPFTMDPGEK